MNQVILNVRVDNTNGTPVDRDFSVQFYANE